MKKLLISLAVLGLSFTETKSQVKSIPDFTFSRMDNGADFKPANLVPAQKSLIVFFDTECSHCMEAITEYNSKEKMLNNLNIILVTRDAKAQVEPFLKKYGPKISVRKNTTILSDLEFSVGPQDFVYLIGRTGSGKSTLLKAIYGELPLSEGTGTVAGFDLLQLKKK
jgi:ABC-type multidrug transport system fused ATPase/permease subunit